jgi:hypothetical protein
MSTFDTSANPDLDPRRRAAQLLNDGRFAEAINLLEPLVDQWGNDSAFWRVFGVAQGSAGNLEQAETCLHHAVELQPDSAAAHYHLGDVLCLRGDVRDARRHAERAIALDDQLTAAQDLLERVDAKRRAMRATGFYVAPQPGSPEVAVLARLVQQDKIAASVGTGPPRQASAAPAAGSGASVTMKVRRADDSGAVTRQWCWDGFVWGIALPAVWIAALWSWMWALVVLVVEAGAWALDWIHPSVERTAAAVAVCAVVALLLGVRGNALSVSGRLWLTVEEFHACHRVWLRWGIGVLALVAVAAVAAVRSPAVNTAFAKLRPVLAAHPSTHP